MWKKKLNRYKGLTFEPSFSLTAQFKMSSQDQDNPVQKKRHDREELQLNGRNLIIHLISDIMIEVIMTEVVSLIHIDIHLTMIGVTHPSFSSTFFSSQVAPLVIHLTMTEVYLMSILISGVKKID